MMKKEFCGDCLGWENEICVNKFSPYYQNPTGTSHTCQQIQTDTQNTDLHPSALRDNVWDTGMRYRD